MTILENIKKSQLQARKEKRANDAATLTTLIGEAEMIGKNDGNRLSTDAEVVAVIKKFVKNIDETVVVLSKDTSKTEKINLLNQEKKLLVSFLPQQLTEDELRHIIGESITDLQEKNPKSIGKVLGFLKEKFSGQYDGALASKIAKEMLS